MTYVNSHKMTVAEQYSPSVDHNCQINCPTASRATYRVKFSGAEGRVYVFSACAGCAKNAAQFDVKEVAA